MNCRTTAFLMFSLCLFFSLPAQELSQTIRGKIVDTESGFPLEAASVFIRMADNKIIGAFSDNLGSYRLDNVPIGRQTINFEFIGYQPVVLNNIEVTSAKEVILNVDMQASAIEIDEVVIHARRNGEASNEMATVSAREFSVVETNLYAGSRGEPARMASNYAGVQGADDSRNDIVIRGNSPQGVLWRLEGINIPNPNHFAIPGTGGGPVTILNNKFLSNSDFYTGAFPAEFANGLAGTFDLNMRNGNNEQHEFSGQLGFLGTELTAEGPINKEKGSSYLAMYRYSTLQLFQFLGINVGTDAIPKYMDGAFRVHLPQKNGAQLNIWGIGGLSDIDIILSEQIAPDTSTLIYGSNDRDQYFGSNTGVVAANYRYPINQSTLFEASLGVSRARIDANHDLIFRHVENDLYVIDSLPPILDYTFQETKYHGYLNYKKRLGLNHTLQAGINVDWYQMRYIDSARSVIPESNGNPAEIRNWQVRWDADEGAALVQPYVQYKYNWQDRLFLTAGITSLYFSLNENSFSPIEPRLGLAYKLPKGHRLSLGLGLHSQIQSPYLYFYGLEREGRDPLEHNHDLGLSKSAHAVVGYDFNFAKNMRLKVEAYYQYLYDIPVEVKPSAFSLINSGSGFSRFFPDTLMNSGTGRNYGLELTLEKFFSDGYYFLFTGSVFDAQYKGSDGVPRNATFNGRVAFNTLFAKEFEIGENSALQLGGKATYTGGRWYGPVDEAASQAALEIIYENEGFNTLKFRPYFRLDGKITYRWNRPKVTHEIAVDLVNVLNRRNILTLTYAPNHPSGNPIREEYQLGFLPLFYYKIDF